MKPIRKTFIMIVWDSSTRYNSNAQSNKQTQRQQWQHSLRIKRGNHSSTVGVRYLRCCGNSQNAIHKMLKEKVLRFNLLYIFLYLFIYLFYFWNVRASAPVSLRLPERLWWWLWWRRRPRRWRQRQRRRHKDGPWIKRWVKWIWNSLDCWAMLGEKYYVFRPIDGLDVGRSLGPKA